MQCKDIPDLPILQFLDINGCYDFKTGCNWFGEGFKNSIHVAMPSDIPEKLVLAKMRTLQKRGLVDGCFCGCRGNFHLTGKGKSFLLFLESEGNHVPRTP